MGSRRTIAVTLALAFGMSVVAAPAFGAGARGTILNSPRLWATVNVCDTADQPDAIGIRGSMPGSGDPDERMFMRFEVQYYVRSERRWRDVAVNGDSGFIFVGSARFRARQAGRTYTVLAPDQAGARFRLRGMVTYEWRKDGEVVRRARRRTTGKHPNTRGADPVGFTAGSCVIS